MINSAKNEYRPDYTVSPGEILEETLAARGIRKKDFADRCGLSAKHVHLIIRGDASVTADTAILFERVLGIDSQIWNNLETDYRSFRARQVAEERTRGLVEWCGRFPVKELVDRGYIEEPKNEGRVVECVLSFFGVASRPAWELKYGSILVSYRHSPAFSSQTESLAAWLRIGELLAQRVETASYERVLFKQALTKIRTLTCNTPGSFVPEMKELCRLAGVAVIFVREFPETHVSGATRWLRSDKAVILLSLRHKSNDHFWFSFFHEGAHILFDGKKNVFVDHDSDDPSEEVKANHFAADILIPPKDYKQFIDKRTSTRASISRFAKSIGIAPGIVVGRLQHQGKLDFSQYNDLKVRLELNQDG